MDLDVAFFQARMRMQRKIDSHAGAAFSEIAEMGERARSAIHERVTFARRSIAQTMRFERARSQS